MRRDFQARYAGSALGFLWSFALPLWQLLLYTFVFAGILKISLQGERTDNFALFLFSGLLPFMAVSEGVTRAATAVTDNAPLVKKLRFPLVLLVVTVVTTALVHEAIALALFLECSPRWDRGAGRAWAGSRSRCRSRSRSPSGSGSCSPRCTCSCATSRRRCGLVVCAWFYFAPHRLSARSCADQSAAQSSSIR